MRKARRKHLPLMREANPKSLTRQWLLASFNQQISAVALRITPYSSRRNSLPSTNNIINLSSRSKNNQKTLYLQVFQSSLKKAWHNKHPLRFQGSKNKACIQRFRKPKCISGISNHRFLLPWAKFSLPDSSLQSTTDLIWASNWTSLHLMQMKIKQGYNSTL